jgi:hypothetical protein
MFEECGKLTCNAMFDPEAKKSCESSSKLQVMMAGMGGCKEYDAAQAANCQCGAPDKTQKRREKLLEGLDHNASPSLPFWQRTFLILFFSFTSQISTKSTILQIHPRLLACWPRPPM